MPRPGFHRGFRDGPDLVMAFIEAAQTMPFERSSATAVSGATHRPALSPGNRRALAPSLSAFADAQSGGILCRQCLGTFPEPRETREMGSCGQAGHGTGK